MTIEPIEQKTIDFYDDQITAVRAEDGTVYVPIRPICNVLNISFAGQNERIGRDAVLSEVVRFVRVTRTNSKGGNPNMAALPLDYLNGWLFGINANRVKDSVRDGLIRYQRECYRVLADAFGRNLVTARPDDVLMTSDSPAALAYRNALEVANLARQQFYLEQRIESAETNLTDLTTRVAAIEAELGHDDRFVTEQQATQISGAVKLIAAELGRASGRNEYGGIYMELYRRYSITSYKRLPAAKFNKAISWLRQWYETLTDGDDAPF